MNSTWQFFVCKNADLVIVLGSRLNIRQTGFNFSGFAKNAKIVHVDIDKSELNKFYLNTFMKINLDLRDFFKLSNSYLKNKDKKKTLTGLVGNSIGNKYSIKQENFVHDKKGLLNPYKAMIRISDFLIEGDKIVCGNASACIIPFQSLEIKKKSKIN